MRAPQDQRAQMLADQLRITGFALARGYIDTQLLAGLRGETRTLIDRFDRGERSVDFWCYDREAGGQQQILYRVHHLERQSGAERCAGVFRAGVLHDLASGVVGAVQATVCAMVVKTPGVNGIPWHRDRVDVNPFRAINLSIFLDEATAENGCFEAVPGSHRLPDDADPDQVRAEGPQVQVAVAPGDVLIHDVRLVHGSGGNRTAALRRSVIVEFAPAHGATT